MLAASAPQGALTLWDAESRQVLGKHRFETNLWCVAFAPDGDTLAWGTAEGVKLWDVGSWRQVEALPGLSVVVGIMDPSYSWRIVICRSPSCVSDDQQLAGCRFYRNEGRLAWRALRSIATYARFWTREPRIATSEATESTAPKRWTSCLPLYAPPVIFTTLCLR